MIKGLFETHIHVTNLENSMRFYGDTLGLQLGRKDEERRIAFYWVGAPGEAMLGLWEKKATEPQHFAFRCDQKDILQYSVLFLKNRNLHPYNFLNDGRETPMVFAWMPALAIYFNDPDGHILEFISMLPGKAHPDAGIISFEAWKQLPGKRQ